MASTTGRRRPMSEINVVPYIDVMLVLLVIFMITAPMLTQGVEVELPDAEAQPVEQQDLEPFVVTVDAQGLYYASLGGEATEPLNAEALMQRTSDIINTNDKTPIYVRGDRDVAYGKVVEAMVMLQQAGAKSVGLLTEAADE